VKKAGHAVLEGEEKSVAARENRGPGEAENRQPQTSGTEQKEVLLLRDLWRGKKKSGHGKKKTHSPKTYKYSNLGKIKKEAFA